jgi:hypothetical protein
MSRCWIWIARSGRVAAAVIAHRSLFRRVDLPGVPAPARLRPILPARQARRACVPASRYQTVIVPCFPSAFLFPQLTCPCTADSRFRPDFRLSRPTGTGGSPLVMATPGVRRAARRPDAAGRAGTGSVRGACRARAGWRAGAAGR